MRESFGFMSRHSQVVVCAFVGIALLSACDNKPAGSLKCPGAAVIGTSVHLPGGSFLMGDGDYYREELPVQNVSVKPFAIDATEVTNDQFQKFVAATGYLTRAERGLDETVAPDLPDELRVPGSLVFLPPEVFDGMSPFNWWRFVEGANWQHPVGPDSDIKEMGDHPVVHIAAEDAIAYADWAGRRLLTEAEWEYAAQKRAAANAEQPSANYWQGMFPITDTADDGYAGLAPVGCFAPNDVGLYDMIGNVWELTSSVYYPDHDKENYVGSYPEGLDPNSPKVPVSVIKGGSYLCAENYCLRYRAQSRQPQDKFLASSHVGFRTAISLKE